MMILNLRCAAGLVYTEGLVDPELGVECGDYCR